MTSLRLETKNLQLILQTPQEVRTSIAHLPPEHRAALSAAWLALLEKSTSPDPWVHGFAIMHRTSGAIVGKCGFKGPPDQSGTVEIAYGLEPGHQGKGYATEAAQALTAYAFTDPRVCLVRAHTLPEPNASTRVLTKCGFQRTGEAIDPEDGLVWRWEKRLLQDSV
jgi:[ribosomal protein S5]-alanine N-acetyltransferase